MPEILLVFTTLPDPASAETLARYLVENNLAACVSAQAPCRSVYRWQGVVETTSETTLLIKTRADRYPQLETAIRERHPYEVPEIVALPVSAGFPAYLQWVANETEGPWAVC
jgi:periplasmic divalent cation tolerance protein